jgi:FkbM family methyltransferase
VFTLSHLQWRLRKARADVADRFGRGFTYVHPSVGPFVYHPSDWISRRLFLYGDFEAPELQFARERARAGGIVLDVGANIGLYTVACARAIGARGRVIAVEPGPGTFAKLRDTCAWLGLSNVEPVQAAAGPTTGTVRLVTKDAGHDVHQHIVDARAEAGAATMEVPMVRLDDLCAQDAEAVVLIKMDVEGHEIGALTGAARILANGRAALIIEFLPFALKAAGASVDELWSLLSRTHRCTAVLADDGATLAAELASIAGCVGDDSFNTFWVPGSGGAEAPS